MTVKVKKRCRDALTRQVSETIIIKLLGQSGTHLLNSKIEYNRCLLPTLAVLGQMGEISREDHEKKLKKRMEELARSGEEMFNQLQKRKSEEGLSNSTQKQTANTADDEQGTSTPANKRVRLDEEARTVLEGILDPIPLGLVPGVALVCDQSAETQGIRTPDVTERIRTPDDARTSSEGTLDPIPLGLVPGVVQMCENSAVKQGTRTPRSTNPTNQNIKSYVKMMIDKKNDLKYQKKFNDDEMMKDEKTMTDEADEMMNNRNSNQTQVQDSMKIVDTHRGSQGVSEESQKI